MVAGPLAIATGAMCGVLAMLASPMLGVNDLGTLVIAATVGAFVGGVAGAPYLVAAEWLDRHTPGEPPSFPWVAAGFTLAAFSAWSVAFEGNGPATIAALGAPLVAIPVHGALMRRGLRPHRVAAGIAGTGFVLWLGAVALHLFLG